MTWQAITTNNTETHEQYYRNILTQLVQIATSKHISSVDNIDAGSSGYVIGDILTYTHSSALHDATFEVTAVAAGVITELRIVDGGAFGRRVATVGIGASGGANYAQGDIVEIDEGHVAGTDFRQRCKIRVDTLSGSAAATISIIEGGGNYDGGTDPAATDATTTKVGPAAGTGAGLVVDTTMQAITGAADLALTGGTGTGAQVDVTLTNTGWVALRDDHDYTFNSLDDEKQVVLQGTVAGGNEPLIGYITWTDASGVDDFRGVLEVVMDTYNDGLTLENQVGANTNSDVPSTNGGSYIPSLDEAEEVWFSMNARKVAGVLKTVGTTVTAYHQFYLGLFDPFGTATESPYPMVMAGSVSGTRVWTETSTDSINVTGICEAFRNSARQGPIFYRRVADGLYIGVHNGNGTVFPIPTTRDRNVFPIGEPDLNDVTGGENDIVGPGNFPWYSSICRNTGSTATILLKPAPGSDEHTLFPAVVQLQVQFVAPIEWGPAGRFANVFWCSATKTDGSNLSSEDTITDPNDPTIVHRVFQTGVRTEPYSFIAMQEA